MRKNRLQTSKRTRIAAGVMTALVAIAVVGLTPTQTGAQNESEIIQQLRNQIQQLQQQIDTLLAGQDGAQENIGDFSLFQENLTRGSTGTEVRRLQRFLNELTFRVAQTGPGSPGQETTFFGPRTEDAVIRFQEANADSVLEPLGLTSGTGFWGPRSRAEANNMILAARQDDTDDDDDQNGDDGNGDDFPMDGQEGSIDDFDILSAPGNESLSEGETERILGFEFQADGSDLSVRRVDVLFQAAQQDQGDEPWEYIDTLTLMRDGEVLAQRDVSDSDDWSEQDGDINGTTGADVYRFRFSDFSTVVDEDETAQFFIRATAQDDIDSDDLDQTFIMAIAESPDSSDGVRAIDEAGINQFAGSVSETVDVRFEEADMGELVVRSATDELEERIVEVDADNETDDVEALRFSMEAEEQPILVEEVTATLNASGTDVENMISRVSLVQNGDEIASESVDGTGQTVDVTFEDIELELDADEEQDFMIMLDVRSTDDQQRFQDGDSVSVDIDADDIQAEELAGGGDDLTDDDLSGSVEGESIFFYEVAPEFTLLSTDSAATPGGDNDEADERGIYTFRFEVTADEDEDIFIPFFDTNATSSGIVVRPTDGTGTVINAPDAADSASLTTQTHADNRQDETWRIPAGQTARFTLRYVFDNTGLSESRFVAGDVTALRWNTEDSDDNLSTFTFGLDDWETDVEFLDN